MEKSENWARVNFYRGKEKIIKEVKKDERKDTL
jgi:RNA polymerase sigma-70 factor (ECF subfamily)